MTVWGDEADGDRPHTLSAEELYKAYMAPGLMEAEGELQEMLKAMQERNVEVGEVIRGQREEIEMLVRRLEDVVRELEGAVEAMEDGRELRREILEMDAVLK